MASRADEVIKRVFESWGKETALDLKQEAEAALVRGGRNNPNTISLEFDEIIKTTSRGDVELNIAARRINKPVKYWRYIEEGRKPGKQPPSDKFGKVWQNEQGIDAREVILRIKAKSRGLKRPDGKLKRAKKQLNYDRAVKQVAFLIARSIGKKGIKPKPYLGKVLTDERIRDLRERLTPALGNKYKLIIKGLE